MPYLSCLIHIFEGWFGVEQLEDYLNFANYLVWVFTPLILLILPYFTIFLLYLTIIFLHIYKRKNVLKEAYSHNLWDGARKTVATLWDGHAAVWHGKQDCICLLCVAVRVCGMEMISFHFTDWEDIEKYNERDICYFLITICTHCACICFKMIFPKYISVC